MPKICLNTSWKHWFLYYGVLVPQKLFTCSHVHFGSDICRMGVTYIQAITIWIPLEFLNTYYMWLSISSCVHILFCFVGCFIGVNFFKLLCRGIVRRRLWLVMISQSLHHNLSRHNLCRWIAPVVSILFHVLGVAWSASIFLIFHPVGLSVGACCA